METLECFWQISRTEIMAAWEVSASEVIYSNHPINSQSNSYFFKWKEIKANYQYTFLTATLNC